jgi:hypothetical protein
LPPHLIYLRQNAAGRVHQNIPRRAIVIYNQGRDRAQLPGNHPAPWGSGGHTYRHRKQKRASDDWLAFKPDLATHKFHQRQPEIPLNLQQANGIHC